MKAYDLQTALAAPESVTELVLYRQPVAAFLRFLGRFQNLRALTLKAVGLKAFPEGLANLPRLQALDLSDNALESLPAELFRLSGLRALNLSGNRLRALPAEWRALPSLKVLLLAGNALEKLPLSLGTLHGLRRLDLRRNALRTLPRPLADLEGLRELLLAGNRLKEVPDFWDAFHHLEILDLSENRLRALPPSLGRLPALQKLLLGRNRLEGLPPVEGWQALHTLELGDNRLGTLPAALANCRRLRILRLPKNSVQHLPPEWGTLERLETLDLSGNELSELPGEMGGLGALRHLSLAGNALLELPESLAGCRRLEALDLRRNPLKGLPTVVFALSGLKELRWSRPLPPPERVLRFLEGCRRLPAAERWSAQVRRVLFEGSRGGGAGLGELPAQTLWEGLSFPFAEVRRACRRELCRRFPAAGSRLRAGARIGLWGRSPLGLSTLQALVEEAGWRLVPMPGEAADIHLPGDFPRAAPPEGFALPWMHESELVAAARQAAGSAFSAEQLERLRELLLSPLQDNVRLAANLLARKAAPQELWTPLLVAWKRCSDPVLKRKLRQGIARSLPPEVAPLLQLRTPFTTPERAAETIRTLAERLGLEAEVLMGVFHVGRV